MKLYHFTSNFHLPSIKEHGLTRGIFPLNFDGYIILMPYIQWLTKNGSFIQPWHDPKYTKLPYDRRANRLTIEIPDKEKEALKNWKMIERSFKKLFIPSFDFDKDKKNWFVFLGKIEPDWIVAIDQK